MSKEAMKLALEALEVCEQHGYIPVRSTREAITALREALAEQPAQQEPVAVVSGYYGGQCAILLIDPARIFNSNTALYTSPPAQRTWVGLTNNELQPIADEYCILFGGWGEDFARAIEAKLKEKNT